MKCIQRVHTDTALEAGACELTQAALHLVLHNKICRACRDMEKAVGPFAGQGRDHGSQLRVAIGKLVGFSDRIDRRPDDWMIDPAAQAFDVVGPGANRLADREALLMLGAIRG